jgi:hypothetical protein
MGVRGTGDEGQEGVVETSRLVTSPIRIEESAKGRPEGRRIRCELLEDVPWLSLRSYGEVVVILAANEPGAVDLPEEMLALLGKGDEEADHERVLAFEGLREIEPEGDTRVFVARSWHGRRPSRELAEAAIADFLAKETGEEDVPFSMHEDGDEESDSNKCGWAFWVRSEDTTSYLKENLEVEWYGTGWDPDGDGEDDDETADAGMSP